MTEFSSLLAALGEPEHQRLIAFADAEAFKGRVPDALIDFWTIHGRGSYQDGKFWFCDPEPFRSVAEAVFQGDPDFHEKDLVAVRRFSFANLTFWSRRLAGPITVDFNLGNVFAFGPDTWINKSTGKRYDDDFIVGALFNRTRTMKVWVTENDEDMHPLAVSRLGRLLSDEMYGFFPALALGGENKSANLSRVKAVEHLTLLSELPRFKLLRTNFNTGTIEFVRYIGA